MSRRDLWQARTVLKSGAESPSVRCVGYGITAVCIALFLYAFVLTLVAAVEANTAGWTAWSLGWGLFGLLFVATATIYVSKRPFTGGYALVAMAAVVATFFCAWGVIPMLAW